MSLARPGWARRGVAWLGTAWQDKARDTHLWIRGWSRHDKTDPGAVGRGSDWHRVATQDKARDTELWILAAGPDSARQCPAGYGRARRGSALRGTAWQGRAGQGKGYGIMGSSWPGSISLDGAGTGIARKG